MRSVIKTKKKGQLSLGNAPAVVMIIGLAFLVMATIALIGEKYGDALPAGNSLTVVNETVLDVNSLTTDYVAQSSACNFEDFTVVQAINISGNLIDADNYTVSTNGGIVFSSITGDIFNNSDWNVTYSFSYAGAACNITGDLQTELGNNTSIAGIILTITLIGIVLTILISVFIGVNKSRRI